MPETTLPVATQWEAASSRALYFGGCIGSSPICAKACEAEAATATVPATAMNSRQSMVFSFTFKKVQRPWRRLKTGKYSANANLNHIEPGRLNSTLRGTLFAF
jgi:hypothetical protein